MSMRSYKIESYVPEESFLLGKDARFCRVAFENCFVIDITNKTSIIATNRTGKLIGESLAKTCSLSMADTASLVNLFNGSSEFLMLPCSQGTLLVYPAWQRLGFALAFLLKERIETVEKAYQSASRCAFSAIFNTEEEPQNNQRMPLKTKLCVLHFYMQHLFGDERQTNLVAQILMTANLMGCRLHETSVTRITVTLDELEFERLGAYLCCAFMTMRRYSGEVSADDEESTGNTANSTHVLQEYGLRIQQSVSQRVESNSVFDLPTKDDVASFTTHPAFRNFKTEEADGIFQLHLSLRQKATLSSVSASKATTELTLVFFLFHKKQAPMDLV